jgi:hypothetical protein
MSGQYVAESAKKITSVATDKRRPAKRVVDPQQPSGA